MVDVSIIIINYNAKALLDNCLSTLFQYTKGISFEVIVVDNGSNETGIEKIISKYFGVKLIRNQNSRGFAAVNNQGFEQSAGQYVLMLNNDVVFFEDVISKVVEFSKSVNNEAIIGCRLLNEDNSYQFSIVDFDSIPNLFGESFFLYKIFKRSKTFNKYHFNFTSSNLTTEVDAVKGAFLFIPQNILRKLEGLDERFYFYYEETDLCYRWKKLGGKIFYYPEASIVHIGGASTDSNLWFKFSNQHLSRIQFFKKHFSGLKLFIMILLHEIGLLIRVPIYFFSGIIKGNKFLIKKSICYWRTMFIFSTKGVSER